MSLYDDIQQLTRSKISEMQLGSVAYISPTAVAVSVHAVFATEDEDEHVSYAAIEHYKQVARKELAGKFSSEGTDNAAHQDDMFSGVLQEYYPIPRNRGDEPQYKLRSLLAPEELDWNIGQLRKSARARLEHADALEAFRDQQFGRSAA